MGILDQFAGLSPDQNQGLLAAAAQMLQSSGPSLMPHSFGQVLGGGLGAYQQSMTAAQEAAQKKAMFEQAQALTGLKIQDAQSDLKNQEMIREREAKIRAEMTPQAQATQSAPMGGSMMANMGVAQPSWMPQQPAAQGQAAPSMPSDPNETAISELMREATVRAKYGDRDGALKAYEMAVKMQPKYSTDFRTARGDDGQLHNYVLSDNGKWKDTGLGVRPEVTEVDLGGTKQFVDKNTVTPGQTFNKTMTFADRQSAARLAFDKSQADGADADMSESMIDAIGQGKFAPPSGMALRNPKIVKMMERVTQKYPEFDATEYAGKMKAMRDFTTGKQGDAVRSFAVATDHLTQLKGLITALDNGNTPLVNKYGNIIAQQTGSVAPTNFDAAKGIVAKEVLKSIVAGGGGVDERQELAHLLDNAKTAKQLNGVVDTYTHLMGAQRDGLMRQYEISTGRKDAATRFNYGAAHDAAPPPPAQKFDMLPPASQFGGKRMRADNGTTYLSDGTKWVKE